MEMSAGISAVRGTDINRRQRLMLCKRSISGGQTIDKSAVEWNHMFRKLKPYLGTTNMSAIGTETSQSLDNEYRPMVPTRSQHQSESLAGGILSNVDAPSIPPGSIWAFTLPRPSSFAIM